MLSENCFVVFYVFSFPAGGYAGTLNLIAPIADPSGRVTIQAKKMRYPVIRYNKTYHISKCSAEFVGYGTAGINWQK